MNKQLKNILNKIEYDCTAEKVLNEIKEMIQDAKESKEENKLSFSITLAFSISDNNVDHFSINTKIGSIIPLLITINTVEVDKNELDNYAEPMIKQFIDSVGSNLKTKFKITTDVENTYVGNDLYKYRVGGYIE